MNQFFSKLNQLFSKNQHTDSSRVRPITGFILASIILAVLSFYFLGSPLVHDWEQRFQARYHLFSSYFKAPVTGGSDIVVVLINDQSLPEGTPRSPIDRRWLSQLIGTVSRHQPALIGLNILLDRPLNPEDDQVLADAISRNGRVILRSDPVYPAIPDFIHAALDYGTLRFRSDSSGAVQEVCSSSATCRSDHIFHTLLFRHFTAGSTGNGGKYLQQNWLPIDFPAAHRLSDTRQYIRIPIFHAYELEQLPVKALENKLVIIGTGFPDLYPLYRTPLPGEEQFLQETEILALAVDMIFSNRFVRSLSPGYSALLMLGLFLILSLLLVKRSVLSGFWFVVAAIPLLFFLAAAAFTFFRLSIPFVLPTVLIVLFLVAGTLQQMMQERFARLMTELKLKEAKVDFLTNELHTHHLFNELSRLSVMISRQPESARAYLVEFAELLRTSLKYGDKPRVPMPVQMDYLNSYLQQQGIIHGERFQFFMDVKGEWGSVQAPWHVFFPLVENAVKAVENVLRSEPDQSVTIGLMLWKEDHRLFFRVKNPVLPDSGRPSTRKGLANLEERLKWSYPRGGYKLSGGQEEQEWIATLQLPLE